MTRPLARDHNALLCRREAFLFAFWVRDAVDREERGFTIESKLGVMPGREYILYYFFSWLVH